MVLTAREREKARSDKEKNMPALNKMPYDPENGHLSKEQFLAKMRKRNELAAKMKAYEEKAKVEIEAEMNELPSAPEPVEKEPKTKANKK